MTSQGLTELDTDGAANMIGNLNKMATRKEMLENI
jgi:hypothetical protein